MIENKIIQLESERAILVGLSTVKVSPLKAKEYIEELAFLAQTAGIQPVKYFIQNLNMPHSSIYVGTGKLQEIKTAAEVLNVSLLIFDDELSAKQLRNIEKETKLRVLDRSSLILHIFGLHARSSQARLQVELAQQQYMLPRLTRLWTHLERQRGGTGTRGGAGEKEIETDRRIIRDRIAFLKKELEKVERQGQERRKNRNDAVRVSLVGYTNVGKSTIMNVLSKSDVLVENKLFATLDTTVRKMNWEFVPFLLSDTVGFIRKLPHHLVECFKSTLAEAQESDILLHVIDVSHPQFEDHIRVVNETLQEIKVGEKKMIMVFNKADLLPQEERERLQETWFGLHHAPAVFLSAIERWNIDLLRKYILDTVREVYAEKYPERTLQQFHFEVEE